MAISFGSQVSPVALVALGDQLWLPPSFSIVSLNDEIDVERCIYIQHGVRGSLKGSSTGATPVNNVGYICYILTLPRWCRLPVPGLFKEPMNDEGRSSKTHFNSSCFLQTSVAVPSFKMLDGVISLSWLCFSPNVFFLYLNLLILFNS